MDHMKFESPDMVQGNIEKIEALFPNCVTETRGEDGKLKKAVNFDLLRQMLSGEVAEGDEAYEFTWVGKKASIVEANKPIRKTLRPCPEESVNWDTTENLYIEGDNLEVLKLLQESYLGKVKMIYIDPPYNTGNDFIYRDDFAMKSDEYEEQLGIFDEETGDRLFKNTDSNGRFHSDWCSMIYSRLMLARNLLSDNGAIFISIDENEDHTLRSICNEVFGNDHYIGSFIWHRRQMPDSRNQSRYSLDHEYVLVYSKDTFTFYGREIDKEKYQNPDNDPRGPWFSADLTGLADKEHRPNLHYDVINPFNGEVYPPNVTRGWCCSKETFNELIKENKILWPSKPGGRPRRKKFLSEINNLQTSISSILDVGFTTEGTRTLQDLFKEKVFDYPKPVSLIRLFVEQSTSRSEVILDFFSGSATTAQAVIEANAKDGFNRKFVLVQLPENHTSRENETICDIGKERIRRAGKKIKDESPLTTQNLDIGFRVLKLADSNMNDVYYSAGDYGQQMLDDMESKIKPDRTDLDLLFGCLLEWGLPLSLPYKSETIDGCTVHTYAPGDPKLEIRDALIACFDEAVPTSVIEAIARRNPLRAVFREECFTSSPDKINVFETFKRLAQGTAVKVI